MGVYLIGDPAQGNQGDNRSGDGIASPEEAILEDEWNRRQNGLLLIVVAVVVALVYFKPKF